VTVRSHQSARCRAGAVIASVAAALAVGLSGCAGSADAAAGRDYVSGAGTVTVVAPADRQPAPALVGSTLEGRTLDVASYRGKVVVLNFWASWCPPCRAEGPALQTVAAQLAPSGVVFIGVDTRDDDRSAARAFLSTIESSYPNLDDADGHLALAFHGTLPPQAIPSTIVLDRQGRIAARILGPTTEPRLTALLTPLLAAPA
jgi:thiol-disulfide isomerase/thioredoxin